MLGQLLFTTRRNAKVTTNLEFVPALAARHAIIQVKRPPGSGKWCRVLCRDAETARAMERASRKRGIS